MRICSGAHRQEIQKMPVRQIWPSKKPNIQKLKNSSSFSLFDFTLLDFKQLQQLEDGTLPEFIKKKRKIEQQYKERLRINEIWREYELEVVEREFINEKKLAAKDFEEKKIDLRESLIIELEDKKKNIDNERNSMELTGDSMEVKQISTRKLRRRPNDPIPLPEKRRKPSPDILLLIISSMRLTSWKIYVSGKPFNKKLSSNPTPKSYTKFHRNQPIFVESKDTGKFSAVITAVGTQEIWVRKISDNQKLRIYVSQLQK
ncbi:hypothetical protein KUTeg_009764, partial [Tegillarca granosa]